jgi:hypothetical protein
MIATLESRKEGLCCYGVKLRGEALVGRLPRKRLEKRPKERMRKNYIVAHGWLVGTEIGLAVERFCNGDEEC